MTEMNLLPWKWERKFISTGPYEQKPWSSCFPPTSSQKTKWLAYGFSTSRPACLKKSCTSLLSKPGWSSVCGKPKRNKGKLPPDVGRFSGSLAAPRGKRHMHYFCFFFLGVGAPVDVVQGYGTTPTSRTIWANRRNPALNSSGYWSIKPMLNKLGWTIYNLIPILYWEFRLWNLWKAFLWDCYISCHIHETKLAKPGASV